jgi:translocator protein
MTGRNHWIGWVLLSFTAALPGARYQPGPWFQRLQKPRWNPPAWIFPPVWTGLYVMMGLAAWQVARMRSRREVRGPLLLYLLQLSLNGLWSWLFFGRHNISLALKDLAALWGSLLATVVAFWRVKPLAGWLLLPYFAWVSFAAYLNYQLQRLNRAASAQKPD